MTTYYVSTKGSDSGNGSSGSPWRTISKAMKANLKAGDEVVVKSGVYKESVMISKGGSAGGYVTLRSEVPGGAKIDVPSGKGFGINVNANYVEVKGFEVYGSSRSGITGNHVHHVKITDNKTHDNTTAGIYFKGSDYLTVQDNLVYNNARLGPSSGISIHHAEAIGGGDKDGGFRIIVKGNVSHHNVAKTGGRTDSNGIIIDQFRADSGYPTYKHATLVEGNIVHSNGGEGIKVYWSDYVTVRGNTAYHNSVDPQAKTTWRAELGNFDSSNNTWVGNIAVADLKANRDNVAIGNFSTGGYKNKNVEWTGNTTFNGKPGDDSVRVNSGNAYPSDKTNKLGVNPNLKALGGSGTSSADADTGGDVSGTSLHGDAGANKLIGGAGDDKLFGYAGSDQLSGRGGTDMLHGGRGKDLLIGGAGDDDFVFRSVADAGKGSARDVIQDFSRSQGDKIDLSGIDANTKMSGNQAFSYIGNDKFSGKAGQLQYKNGIVAGDVNGDKAADFQIDIANDHWLRAGDFIL